MLLLDEPFTALDEELRRALGAAVRAFTDERGLPTLLVTHDRAEARALADRVVEIREGRTIASGGITLVPCAS